jgi:hypothetical protein
MKHIAVFSRYFHENASPPYRFHATFAGTIVPASAMAADLPPTAPPQARPPFSSGGRKPVQKQRVKTPRGLADPVARQASDGFGITLPAAW